jgi:hypothetical protein
MVTSEACTQWVNNKISRFSLSFNPSLKVGFQGSRVISDGGLLLVRELDERLVRMEDRRECSDEKIVSRSRTRRDGCTMVLFSRSKKEIPI